MEGENLNNADVLSLCNPGDPEQKITISTKSTMEKGRNQRGTSDPIVHLLLLFCVFLHTLFFFRQNSRNKGERGKEGQITVNSRRRPLLISVAKYRGSRAWSVSPLHPRLAYITRCGRHVKNRKRRVWTGLPCLVNLYFG